MADRTGAKPFGASYPYPYPGAGQGKAGSVLGASLSTPLSAPVQARQKRPNPSTDFSFRDLNPWRQDNPEGPKPPPGGALPDKNPPAPDNKPPARPVPPLPEINPEEWRKYLPNSKDLNEFTRLFVKILPQMMDPGGVKIVKQGDGRTIRQDQWREQLQDIQAGQTELTGIQTRFESDTTLSESARRLVLQAPLDRIKTQQTALNALLPRLNEESSRYERANLKLDVLSRAEGDTPLTKAVLAERWQKMETAHTDRVKTLQQEALTLSQELTALTQKQAALPDALTRPDGPVQTLVGKIKTNQQDMASANDEMLVLAILRPEMSAVLEADKPSKALDETKIKLKEKSKAAEAVFTDVKGRQAKLNTEKETLEMVLDRLDHPEKWTDAEKATALTVVKDFVSAQKAELTTLQHRIEASQGKVAADSAGLDALRLPQDHPDLAQKWGKHVMLSVSTGQEQSAIFQEHFRSLMTRLETADSLPDAMVATTQQDAKSFRLKRPFFLGSESVYSTPLVSTNRLDIWKKPGALKPDEAPPKKRVVLYIQGHHHVDAQRRWMDQDETKMKEQLSKTFDLPGAPVEWVSMKGKTKADVAAEFDRLKREATPDTEFLVVMNGHGMQKPTENEAERGKLDLALEGSTVGHFQLTATEDLTENDMKTELDKLSASRGVLMMMSSCHSGAWIAQNNPPKRHESA